MTMVDIEDVKLEEKRGYLIVSMQVAREGKVLLRKTDNIRELYNILKRLTDESKVSIEHAFLLILMFLIRL